MLGNIGPLEIIVVLIIALVVFGPKRLPELGSIDLVLLTNPRTERRPAVQALIATVLTSGAQSLAAPNDRRGGDG